MLTNLGACLQLRALNKPALVNTGWLNTLITQADAAIKKYCKRDLEQFNYTHIFNADNRRFVVVKQWPLIQAQTYLAASSYGVALPTGTINVLSTTGFPSGSDANGTPATIAVQTSPGSGNSSNWTFVTYTGTTATSFTGVSGGVGNLDSTTDQTNGRGRIGMPVCWYDPAGYGGQAPGSFAALTMLVPGVNYMVELDAAYPNSTRGLIRKLGGTGSPSFVGFLPQMIYSGKLAAYRQPVWIRSNGGEVKVAYSAGYTTVPADLAQATIQFVAQLARVMPNGGNMSSESLGAYSYSMLYGGDNPELGEIRRTLAPYREISWGVGG